MLPLVGCLGRVSPDDHPSRPCKIGDGLEPTIDEIFPGRCIFSYKRTVPLYEVVEGKRTLRYMDSEEAYYTVLAGMRRWKKAHPTAIIHNVQVIGTLEEMPTRFLVEYASRRED